VLRLAWPSNAEADELAQDERDVDIVAFGHPAPRIYTDKDGLPQNTIETLVFDRRGYLWVGTQDGACAYNGRTFRCVNMPKRSTSNWIRAILPAADGSLWLGADDGGTARLSPDGAIAAFGTAEGLPHGRVRALIEIEGTERGSEIWAGTDRGLARFEGTVWAPLDQPDILRNGGVLAMALSHDPGGGATIWAGGEKGLAAFSGGRWSIVELPAEVGGAAVTSLYASDRDHLLYVGSDRGLLRLDLMRERASSSTGGRAFRAAPPWTLTTVRDGLPGNAITVIRESVDVAGRAVLWAGTESGLARHEGRKWRVFDARIGLPNSVVKSLAVTPPGSGRVSVWVGTFGGLVRLVSGTWTSFDVASGLPDSVVFATLETEDSAHWLGTLGGGLVRFDGGWTRLGPKQGMVDQRIFSLLETPGSLWVGTRGGGIVRLVDGGTRPVEPPSGLSDPYVYSLGKSTSDAGELEIWAGTRLGLAKLERGRWVRETGVPTQYVTVMRETRAADGARTFWVGTRGAGLAERSHGVWSMHDTTEGLIGNRVSSLLETTSPSGARTLWIGTLGTGLSRTRIDRGALHFDNWTASSSPLVPADSIYSLETDAKGRVYVFTSHGIARLTPKTPDPARDEDWEVYVFTTRDGLPSDGCTQASSMVDRRGRLWTGTVGGAAVYDPSEDVEDQVQKPLFIERATTAAGTAIRPGSKLGYRDRGIRFEYALLSYFGEADTRFRTQLVGLDAEPSAWAEDAKKEYPTLPDGRYTFRVWGRDSAGNTSGPVEIPFTVDAAPWATAWAYAGYALGLLGLTASVIALRTRALHRRNRQLSGVVAERTRELEQANAALREQSLTDPLTGLHNRRYVDLTIGEDIAQVVRLHQNLQKKGIGGIVVNTDIVFLVVDIDHFKQINDEHGHKAGDAVLRQIGEILRAATRSTDTVVRWGGEEFLIVARSASRYEIDSLSERIRHAVEKHVFQLGNGSSARRTCSIGFMPFPVLDGGLEILGWEQVIDVADRCLYAAKDAGRNAWVGVMLTEKASGLGATPPPGWDLGALIAGGALRVVSSVPDPSLLNWSKPGRLGS
jgi:diguanylate cyclase (GGDEF)-like protein